MKTVENHASSPFNPIGGRTTDPQKERGMSEYHTKRNVFLRQRDERKRVRLRNQFLCLIVNAQRSGTHAKSPQIKTYHCEDVVIVEELLLLLRTANEVFQLFV